MQLIFDEKEHIGSNIFTYWFKLKEPVKHIAGQFTEIHLPHDSPDKRGIKRWFTVSSSPSETRKSISTRFLDDKGSSFKRTLNALAPGAELEVADPDGDFVLPEDKNQPLVFVAGGIGVTPYRSMIKFLTDTHEKRNIHLIYAVNTAEDLVFKELFEAYGAKVTCVLATPPADWRGESGKLNGQRIVDLAGDTKGKLIYLSGPEPMVEAFEKQLKDLGLPASQLKTDFFPGYEDLASQLL